MVCNSKFKSNRTRLGACIFCCSCWLQMSARLDRATMLQRQRLARQHPVLQICLQQQQQLVEQQARTKSPTALPAAVAAAGEQRAAAGTAEMTGMGGGL
jgi:uncharacterized protein YdeI (YjbR/CyaY-like superfamily)